MSTTRRESADQARQRLGITGPGQICTCGCGRVPSSRRMWFSDECVRAWQIINCPATARSAVYKRDQGICAACGCDTEALCRRRYEEQKYWEKLARMEAVQRSNDDCKLPRDLRRHTSYGAYYTEAMEEMRLHYLSDGWPDTGDSWWQMDHIVEVVRGGGQCGLENLQTLCVPCHKAKTARLAAERAEERRRAKAGEDLQMSLFTREAG